MHPWLGSRTVLSLLVTTIALSCTNKPEEKHAAIEVPMKPVTASTPQASKSDQPPPAEREFRAAWVATVGNIDWPTRPGLSTEEQQKEVIAILDRAREINLNAIVLQVRTSADALYDSKLEPWSYFLTGKQGQAPDPYYDPLKFWIDQAHARGIELHAWFNPYRTHSGGSRAEKAPLHVSNSKPEIDKTYGKLGWMDPGEPAAQDQSYAVFMDVVDRYDVDGIHIDDYFYPYPDAVNPDDKNDKREVPFPDDASYKKYTDAGGKLKREDWRRENIDKLIKRIYEGTKTRKKHVQFGISPFGIPRPGLPGIEYVKGFDQYDKLYADAPLWLREGWCDYMVPQLYWKIGAPNQPYLGLLNWWVNNNPKCRHIYAGLFTSRIDWSENSWSPDEILGQITITRLVKGGGGNVHFSMMALTQNRKKISDLLRDGLYAQPALVPASTWLGDTPPPAPVNLKADRVAGDAVAVISAQTTGQSSPAVQPVQRVPTTARFSPLSTRPAVDPKLKSVHVAWQPALQAGSTPWLWAVYYKQGEAWKLKVVPGAQLRTGLRDDATAGPATHIAVASVDRLGNESKRTVIETGFTKSEK